MVEEITAVDPAGNDVVVFGEEPSPDRFWASRLAIQLLVFNRHARESPSWCALSIAGTGLWLYITAVWILALITQYR
ncbi:MAG: hypothetical protein ABSB59_11200 [Streptosporangiaceae bacterium]|jgi:hypothetical protein